MSDYWTGLIEYGNQNMKKIMTPFGMMENHAVSKYSLTFETFKRQVNFAIERRLGCSIYDLPDTINFSDYWDDDCKSEDDFWNMVEQATEDLLYDNGFELDLC